MGSQGTPHDEFRPSEEKEADQAFRSPKPSTKTASSTVGAKDKKKKKKESRKQGTK